MTPTDLRRLIEAATMGRWFAEDRDVRADTDDGSDERVATVDGGYESSGGLRQKADAQLIATARNLLPLFVDLMEAAQDHLDVCLSSEQMCMGCEFTHRPHSCGKELRAALEKIKEFK